jgi:ribosome biogenesis GTPase
VVSPPLHPRLIDRYLLAIHHGGCEPVLVVNKLDLADHATRLEELHKLKPYEGLNIPTFECIAHSGQGIAQLRSALAGKTAAFVGHSGVGKSSIVNAFDPKLQQDVGDVSATYGRGTHTTTRSSLIDLGDVRVIDTPGIRSFGLWNIGSEELKLYFPEFERVGRCRFSDCSHVHEPRCAVKDAAESGAIPKERYTTYLRLLQEL